MKKNSTAVAVKTQNNAGLAVQQAQQLAPAQQMITMLIDLAKDKSVDVDKFERLMAMHDRMVLDQRKSAFDDAMAQVQARVTPVVAYGKRSDKQNGKYAEYGDIMAMLRPLLADAGLSVSCSEVEKGEKKTKFVLKVSKSGHTELFYRTFADDTASRNSQGVGIRPAIQDDGSTTTYALRYMVKPVFNIVEIGEDNDGEEPEFIGPGQCARIRELLNETGTKEAEFLRMIAKVEKIEDISTKDFTRVMNALQTKLREKVKTSKTDSQGTTPDSHARQGTNGTNSRHGGAEGGAMARAGTAQPVSDSASAQTKPDPTSDWVDNSGTKKPEALTTKLLKAMEEAQTIQALQSVGEQARSAPESEKGILREVYMARMKQLEKDEGDGMDESGPGAGNDPERPLTDLELDELGNLRLDHSIDPGTWFRYKQGTLGVPKSAELKWKHFVQARAWILRGGRE